LSAIPDSINRDGLSNPSLLSLTAGYPNLDGSGTVPPLRRLIYTELTYTGLMKRIVNLTVVTLLAALLPLPVLRAAEKQYVPGQIVTVEEKFHERVLYYLVNTPVTQDDPYYELSLRSGDLVLLTEYTPRHAADELPEGWKGGSKVEMKVTDKHHVMVRQPEGIELQLLIVKRSVEPVQPLVSKPASVQN